MCTVSEEQWAEVLLLAQEMDVDLSYLTREACLLGVKTLNEQRLNARILESTAVA